MATRYKTGSSKYFGQAPLPSGYDVKSTPEGFNIPPVGIEDVDTGLFNLFDKEIPLQVTAPDSNTGAAVLKSVPIIFAAGEKWAMLKKGRAPRDKKGSLILPLITIGRKSIVQTPNDDITGRGINQQNGEIVIRRRLDKSDRNFQNLVNRLLIKNQSNVAVNPEDETLTGQLTTLREVGDRSNEIEALDGALMHSNKANNVWETITVPTPQFFTAQYDVIIWTQYSVQMNQILEQLISSFLPQGNAWKINASDHNGVNKGYWFIATVDGNAFNSSDNFDDMSMTERTIKCIFSIKVPGYIFASATPGAPIPIRRYVSVPTIDFSISTGIGEETNGDITIDNPYMGADDPTLPSDINGSNTIDQRQDGTTRLNPNRISKHDPAYEGLPRGRTPAQYKKITGLNHKGEVICRYVKVKNINQHSGETVYSSTDLGGLKITTVDD